MAQDEGPWGDTRQAPKGRDLGLVSKARFRCQAQREVMLESEEVSEADFQSRE